MLKSNCRIGMKVYFGRPNGEKTLSEIVKVNPSRAKVKTLEQRGNGRGSRVGSVWTVPYSSLQLADGETQSVAQAPLVNRLLYSLLCDDNLILEALFDCYNRLEPENLSCDGILSPSRVNVNRRKLLRKVRGLQMALGREISEEEMHTWYVSKQEYLESRRVRKLNAIADANLIQGVVNV